MTANKDRYFYQQQTLQPKTKTVTVNVGKFKNGWLCQMHYRGEFVGQVWNKSAQEALSVAEKHAITAGFTHAKVIETHPNRVEAKMYRSKIDGETLKVRTVIEPKHATLPDLPTSFPPLPKTRLATIETKLQSSFWYAFKVKHGKKTLFEDEAIAEDNAIGLATKWAANNGFTHYQINTHPVIRSLGLAPTETAIKVCIIVEKVYLGRPAEAIVKDATGQLHLARARASSEAFNLAQDWARKNGFTHYKTCPSSFAFSL